MHSLPMESSHFPLSPISAGYSSQEETAFIIHNETAAKMSSSSVKRANIHSGEVSATICSNCGTTTTPLWRRSPQGNTICNACGLYFKARKQFRPITLTRTNNRKNTDGPTECSSEAASGSCPGGGNCNGTGGSESCAGCPAFNQHQVHRQVLVCANCETKTTPLWRRDDEGNTICNACGLYYRLHHTHRPVSMKRSIIKRRKRIVVAGQQDIEDLRSEHSDWTDVSPEPVVHKQRGSRSVEKNNDRSSMMNNQIAGNDTALGVPAIEDYIVPRRSNPLPTTYTSVFNTHKVPKLTLTASPPPSPPASSTEPSTMYNYQPSTPPPFSFTPSSGAPDLSLPISPQPRDVYTPLLPPISPKRPVHCGVDFLLNDTLSSSPPRFILPPISASFMQHDTPSSHSHSQHPAIVSPSPSFAEPRNIAEIDAAMQRLAELRRQMMSAGRQ